MAGRLQLIEQKLIALDPAGFQNLCDAYIILHEKEYKSFNRTGSQLGKQKTIPGTPDSFIRLSNDKLICIEFTTQTESIVNKIIGDIEKCLKSSLKSCADDQINHIMVCFNSRLSLAEETEIQSFSKSKNIKLELIGIDTLALEIMSKYFLLSREFLGLAIDTGQILPIHQFISEYNNKANQLSTPLDNIFLHRNKEIDEILTHLENEDLLILSGAPGVGKTKLGIEVSLIFVKDNPSYEAFVIHKKDVDIFEDLKIQLQEDKNYLLLIDDANRQISNLSQILGVFKGTQKGRIKIILTARNYALSDIYNTILEFHSHIIYIQKFTDEELIEILKSDSFKIFNSNYHKKIVAISEGNIRLAVMSARLANEKQTDFLWGDVSDLFDSYFQNFLKDDDLFENKSLLKVLAIISFFFTINRQDKQFITTLLKLFEIDYYSFNESIEELHKRELIEVKYNHARISEQVMATYFFFKVFIKDDLLSFNTLLFSYFPEWKTRFKDSIIPANNSFGYDNIKSKINICLNEYLKSVINDESKVLDFLDLFWFYMPEDTLTYFYNEVHSLTDPINPVYKTDYEHNDFVFKKDPTIDFIIRYFDHPTEWFLPSVELSFEYIRKKPEHLPEFIRRIREHLLFDESDEKYAFKRQSVFIDHLISKLNANNPHYLSSFFALTETFLQHTFQITHAVRKHRIEWYDYQLLFDEITITIRTKIWESLFNLFNKYPEDVFNVIHKFKPIHNKLIPEIIELDLNLLIPFIQDNFDSAVFKHAYYVQDINYWFDKEERIINRSYRQLKYRFLTPEYLDFRKLDWNRLKDKDELDFNNFQEYDSLKTEEIKNSFIFQDEEDFDRLFTAIENHLSIKKNDYYSISQSIDIVLEENFRRNNDLGFKLLRRILTNKTKELPIFQRTLRLIENQSKEWSLKLWDELCFWENINKDNWILTFFSFLPDNYIDEPYCIRLTDFIQKIEKFGYLTIENYSRFRICDPNLIKKIILISLDKNKSKSATLVFSDSVFSEHLDYFESDYELIKQSYFQQYSFNHTQIYDHRGYGFKQIFSVHPEFLVDFVEEFYSAHDLSGRDSDPNLSFIWDSETHFDLIDKAFAVLSGNNLYYRIGEHSICNFFNGLNDPQKENAYIFLKKYINSNYKNSTRINMIFMAIRQCFNNKFEDLLHLYLSVNSEVAEFGEINWAGDVGAQMGEVNFGELYAKKWENILDIVNRSNNKLSIIPIQKFLKNKISGYHKWADNERERKFLFPDW
jgi:hypothetical protein